MTNQNTAALLGEDGDIEKLRELSDAAPAGPWDALTPEIVGCPSGEKANIAYAPGIASFVAGAVNYVRVALARTNNTDPALEIFRLRCQAARLESKYGLTGEAENIRDAAQAAEIDALREDLEEAWFERDGELMDALARADELQAEVDVLKAKNERLAEALRELVDVFSESGMYDEEVFAKARAELKERAASASTGSPSDDLSPLLDNLMRAAYDDGDRGREKFSGATMAAREAVLAHVRGASAPPAEAQAQGGGEVAWRVPVLQSPFGERLDHGVRDELVLVMHRGAHGWKAAGHALLAHQLYVKNVGPLCAASHEVAVVGLSGGGWRTVWARSDDDVTHPAPPSAPAGVEGLVAKLRAVLCDPAGNVCIEGSDADRAEVQGALDALEALAKQPAAPRAGQATGITAAELGYALKRATPAQVIEYLEDDANMRAALSIHFEEQHDQQPAAPSGEAVAQRAETPEEEGRRLAQNECIGLSDLYGTVSYENLEGERFARLVAAFRDARWGGGGALAAQQQGGV